MVDGKESIVSNAPALRVVGNALLSIEGSSREHLICCSSLVLLVSSVVNWQKQKNDLPTLTFWTRYRKQTSFV